MASSCEWAEAGRAAETAVSAAERWLLGAMGGGETAVESGARRFALTLGRALELALLLDHALWSWEHEDGRAAAAARRFAQIGVNHIRPADPADALALANDMS